MTSTRAPGVNAPPTACSGRHREREGDLPRCQRRAEAERLRSGNRLERPGIDVLAGEDRQRRVLPDDGIERPGGVRRHADRADPDELDHVGGDLGQHGDVDRGPDDLGPRLGEPVGPGGDEARDDEDDEIDGPAHTHGRALPY